MQDPADGATQEEWRPIEHYEGMYSVSNLGRVRGEDRTITTKAGWQKFCKGRLLRYNTTNRGLLFVTLSWNNEAQSRMVHDLVAEAFLGPRPEGLVVKHGAGGHLDNRAENLSFGLPMDRSERAAIVRAAVPRGEAHWQSKLDEKAVRVIRSMPRDRGTVRALAQAYGVTTVAIRCVVKGKTWAHVV